MVRGIILAAGSSRRMGKNKLSLYLGEETVLQRVVKEAKNSKLSEIVVVYGAYQPNNIDEELIYNPHHEDGMSTSIINGLKDFDGDGVMLLLGDMPFVTAEMIDELLIEFDRGIKHLVAPYHNGKRGNPVIIGKKYFSQLRDLKGDKGARDIINTYMDDVEAVEIDNAGIFMDLDEEEAYELALSYDKKRNAL